jgi:pimeloyl-ACP methyl ester carboxylesterase
MKISREFIDTPAGQVHARAHPGRGVPLIMLHAAPGSARMLGPLQQRMSSPTLAPDLPGMGDSDALADIGAGAGEPDIAAFSAPLIAMLAAKGVTDYDVYGTLSGARVALQLANYAPVPPRRVILDGVGFPKPDELPELLEQYAPHIAPSVDGSHLITTFQLCRDQYLFYPWYARDAAHRRPNGLPSAFALHTKTMEALKSADAFRPLIRAAFRYDCAAEIARVTRPMLVSADALAFASGAATLNEPPAEPLTASAENLDARAAAINRFLEN